MKTLRSLLVLSMLTLVPLATGCAASTSGEEDVSPAASDTGEDALTSSSDRVALLDALRVRVKKDFANARSLASYKLVFVVERINNNATKAAIQARIMKRNAQGKDFELADADYKGSVYEADIREGVFDGPGVTAILTKANGKWTIAKKGSGDEMLEGYVVGPTDVAFESWDRDFGVPRAWLGL